MPDPTPMVRAHGVWADMTRRHADHQATAPRDGVPAHRPKAAVLACSDARVPPSVLFGQAAGSLFVVRLAGNSATPGAIASLTYAVAHLGVELVVVLGHTSCGAVTAAVEGAPDPTLGPVLTPIDEMLTACRHCDSVDAAVAANVRHNVARLRRDRGHLGAAVRAGDVIVRGAVHDLATGELVDVDGDGAIDATTPTPITDTVGNPTSIQPTSNPTSIRPTTTELTGSHS
jgi:carbonic anhydrase